jgi:hypothetical protein
MSDIRVVNINKQSNSMVHDHFWACHSRSTSQEIPRILCNPKSISLLTRPWHWVCLSWDPWIKCTTSQPISLSHIWILHFIYAKLSWEVNNLDIFRHTFCTNSAFLPSVLLVRLKTLKWFNPIILEEIKNYKLLVIFHLHSSVESKYFPKTINILN